MIELTPFIECFLQTLNESFGERVWFVGLQGSYGRGDATDESDIDLVVVLDELSASDIQIYNAMLDTLPHREQLCGFLSGKKELLNWEPSELFQFYYDTKPIKGSLDDLLPLLDVNGAIKIGLCNIYHGCVHNMLYDKSEEILKALHKSAFFVAQAIYFKQTGKYVSKQSDLLSVASSEDNTIISTFIALKNGKTVDFHEASKALFHWAKKLL